MAKRIWLEQSLFALLFLQVSFKFAVAGSTIKFLPGFEGPLPFELETGYIGVGESDEVQLFYYFVKSESNPRVDPLVLWMTGGPGCTSLTALAYEFGPLKFEKVDNVSSLPRLVSNPDSWTEVASFIFLDTPVGTGFSYATNSEAAKTNTMIACNEAVEFLRKFLIDHPEFISNPFYVGGDSFSGLIVPIVTELISEGNEKGIEPPIDLKGYLLGNPLTIPTDNNYRVPVAHGLGLISNELYQVTHFSDFPHCFCPSALLAHDMASHVLQTVLKNVCNRLYHSASTKKVKIGCSHSPSLVTQLPFRK